MAHPDVPYDSAPSVTPTTSSGDDYLHAQASPNDFGAQVGKSEEGVGQQAEQSADKFRGMIFETAANTAETSYIKQAGVLTGKFKSLEGLAAQAAIPQYEKDMTDLRQNLRGNLPGGAARMFDQLTTRHEGYALSDAYSYGASQVKKATLDSNNAVAETAISRAGDSSVAASDEQFGGIIGDVKHSIASMMELQGYGQYAQTDPKTGAVTFDQSTPEGKNAATVYQNELDKRTGAAWENRLHTLADQNISTAYDKFKQNRADIPGEAQVKLDQFFQPKIRDYEARTGADAVLSKYDQQYKAQTFGPSAQKTDAGDVSKAISTQEWQGKGPAPTSIDGAVGNHQILPGTFAQYAKPGEVVTNAKDNDAVYNRIIDDYKQKYNNDPARVAVAYFSGPGNVAPAGSPTPWLKDAHDGNGKSVSSYVSDVTNRIQGGTSQATIGTPGVTGAAVPSLADSYRRDYTKIIDDVRASARQTHKNDPAFEDKMVANTEQKLNTVIRQQELSFKADNDLVYRAFNGDMSKGNKPTSVEQLEAIGPDVKQAWANMQTNNPQTASLIENRILTVNSKPANIEASQQNRYGSGFSNLLQNVYSPNGINNVADLYQYTGPHGIITNEGMDVLKKEIESKQTPEGQAVAQAKSRLFERGATVISGGIKSYGFADPKGEKLHNQWLAVAMNDYNRGLATGKTPTQLLNPESPDYVGKSLSLFTRSTAEMMKDHIVDNEPRDLAAIDSDVKFGKLSAEQAKGEAAQSIKDSYKNGQMTKQDVQMAMVRFGLLSKAAQQVPPKPGLTETE